MKQYFIGFICILFFAVSCGGNSGTSKSESTSTSSSGSSSSVSTCKTCGISYNVANLPYGKYCSQNCCAAYEGLSSKCGY